MAKTYTDKERKQILSKIKEVYQSSNEIGVKEACEAAGISDATFYNWKHRFEDFSFKTTNSKNETAANNSKMISSDKEQKIVNLKKDKPFLGFKKISKQLQYSYGIKVSARKVKKILQKHNLAETDYPKPKKKHKPRRFERLSRNEMWLMDIMYYRLKKEGRFYLISILDDYSRYITSYGVFKRQTIDNIIDILHQAIEEYGLPKELLTDRGTQFHSWKGKSKFNKLLDNLGIKHILASPQHPQTIGKIESFHRNIQRELLRQKEFESIEEVKAAIKNYIEYYNQERVHMGIDYLTPADRYFGLKQDKEKLLEKQKNSSDHLYLTGRIEGQPFRAKENSKGVIELYLAGKKRDHQLNKQKLKKLLQLS